MVWQSGAKRSCGRQFSVRISGRAFLALSLWLLIVPVQWVAAAMASAWVHEAGHLIALWMCGIRVWDMEIDAFGARIRTAPLMPKEELFCALAGPFAGVLICLFWCVAPRMAICAALQTVFNLLPVYPLDGGRALRAARNICCKDGGFGVQ